MTRVLRSGAVAVVALFALAGTALLAPSAALAAAPLTAAERLCGAQGGQFTTPDALSYHCTQGSFSEAQLAVAQRQCENVYKGSFSGVPGSYHCFGIAS